ncbi:hypothetical protein [Tunicatimonas pelagia]|uniref:hypothetical protein n=1 Tax=Tunicatimonas pelagia TaxID=931531 RepID=UPI00266691D0|nr:hypothetical protein [Tunicatimonas pelagia]WKN43004.1 hypothetical protein P0M28_28605 [Tunicatimonas pelagia]
MSNYVFRLIGSLLVSGVLFSACSEDEGGTTPTPDVPDTSEEVVPQYTMLASVGDQEYMVTTHDLTSGEISVVGRGVEIESYGNAEARDGYVYTINYRGGNVEQYKVTVDGLDNVASLSMASLSPSGGFRIMQQTPEGDLLLMNWPDDNGQSTFAIVGLPSFTVKSSGSFALPDVGGLDPEEIGGVVKGDKIYLGTMYTNRGEWTTFPDSLITWKLDYPSFTNPEMMVSTASLGTVAGFSGSSSVLDEQGDIYQQNIRSKHWYNMGTREEMPTVFVRIRDGEYDDSYVFNVSEQFPGTVSLIGFVYAGNGIA